MQKPVNFTNSTCNSASIMYIDFKYYFAKKIQLFEFFFNLFSKRQLYPFV